MNDILFTATGKIQDLVTDVQMYIAYNIDTKLQQSIMNDFGVLISGMSLSDVINVTISKRNTPYNSWQTQHNSGLRVHIEEMQ